MDAKTETHDAAYLAFQRALIEDPEMMKEKIARFEKAFGRDSKSRTRKQWSNLVRVYGMQTVCEQEKLTESEVNLNCMSLTERLKFKARAVK
jgi:hypothetical protein